MSLQIKDSDLDGGSHPWSKIQRTRGINPQSGIEMIEAIDSMDWDLKELEESIYGLGFERVKAVDPWSEI
jgi:hypothetical protein